MQKHSALPARPGLPERVCSGRTVWREPYRNRTRQDDSAQLS